jgi:hypothetical protein
MHPRKGEATPDEEMTIRSLLTPKADGWRRPQADANLQL